MSKNRIPQIISAFAVMVVMLVYSLGLPSSTFAADNPPSLYKTEAGRITIEVDPRVELIGIVFRLAGNPEYNDGTLKTYAKAIEQHFGDFDNHPVVKMAISLRNKRLMSCDGPMSLAVHIDNNYRLRKTTEEWPSTLDFRWKKQEAEEFLEQLRQFATQTKFNEFFKAPGPIYEQGIRPCECVMAQKDVVVGQGAMVLKSLISDDFGQWLSDFYGVTNTGDLKLVLGFVNGFANYGPRFTDGRISEKYAIIGMRPFDPANTVIFLPQQIGIVAHEFCHSFTNPVVDKYMDKLQPTGERLYKKHGPALRSRGCQEWRSMMYETAVRACVASFIRNSVVDPGYMEHYLKREDRHGFVWTEDMGNFLKTYENNRDKYPTFESFFPEFVKFLNDYSIKAKM
ncbi:MAG: DUF4932 domain-containing protein [Planctomycetota bacterium]|jgi:hypothetical protein